MYFRTNVATALVLLTIVKTNIIDGHVQFYTANVCVKGDDDVYYFGVTQEHCIDMCKGRSMCESVNYHVYKSMCILHFQTTKEDTCRASGYIYSRKSDWNYNVPEQCDLCTANQTCTTNEKTDKHDCTFQECTKPRALRYGQLLGNRRTVGSRIMYTCYSWGFEMDPPTAASQVCEPTGQWSGDTPHCRPVSSRVCPRGWTEFLLGESCYYNDMKENLNFDEATVFCQQIQPRSHLLTIETGEEYSNVTKLMDDWFGNAAIAGHQVWEGIVARGSSWLYKHTNTLVQWNKWGPGEPNNDYEDVGCLYKASNAVWFENDCSRDAPRKRTVCEIEWKDLYQ